MITVIVAFVANLLIAIAKTVAASLTASASMVAEAAHSWADTGNEIFLLIAERRSDRQRDTRHPMGYGKEAYVWSMFAAFGLFTAGAVVSISHGISELRNPEPASDFVIAYVVLGIAFVLEGISFAQAFRQTRRNADRLRRRHLAYVLNTSNPTLRAVFFEDAAALVGLLIAFGGIASAPGDRLAGAGRDRLDPGRCPAGRDRRGADQPQPAVPDRRGGAHGLPQPGAGPSCSPHPRSTGSPTCTWSSSDRSGCSWWPRST